MSDLTGMIELWSTNKTSGPINVLLSIHVCINDVVRVVGNVHEYARLLI